MKNIKVIRRKLRTRFDDKQTVTDPISALQGLGNGVVDVPNQAGMVYIRVGNEENYGTAFNNRTPHTDNLSVLVGYDPVTDPARRLFQVLSIAQTAYVDAGNQPIPFVGPHHSTHEWGGGDDTFIEWRRIMGLRVGRPALYVVTVDPGVIIRAGVHQYIPSTPVDLTFEQGALIGTQAQYILIYLDSVGAVQHLGGAVKASTAALSISDIPIAPGAGDYELGAVRLHANAPFYIGDTPSDPDIWDLRYPASAAWSSGAGWSLLGNAGTMAGTNFMGTTDNIDVVFKANNVERMRLLPANTAVMFGEAAHGIGTLANNAVINVGDAHSASFVSTVYGTNIPSFQGLRALGTRAAPTKVLTDTYLLTMGGLGYATAGWESGARGSFNILAAEDHDTTHGTYATIRTTPIGGIATAEVARFDNLGMSLPNLTASTAIYADANKRIQSLANAVGYFYNSGAGAFSYVASPVPALTATYIGYGDAGGLLTGSSALTWDGHYTKITHATSPGIILYIDGTHSTGIYCSIGGVHINPINGIHYFQYDGTNYCKMSVSVVGVTTFATLPVGAGFVFTPPVTFSAAPLFSMMSNTWLLYAGASGVLSGSANATLDASGNAKFLGIVGVGGTPEAGAEFEVVLPTSAYYAKLSGTAWGLRVGQLQSGIQFIALGVNKTGADNNYIAKTNNNAAVSHSILQFNYNGTLSYLWQAYQADGTVLAPTSVFSITGAGALTALGAFGCNAKAAQTAYASGGALNAYGAGANGLDTGANMAALHALVVAMRAALVANGILS